MTISFFPEYEKMACCGIVIYTYQSNRKCNKTLYGISYNIGIKILIMPLDYYGSTKLMEIHNKYTLTQHICLNQGILDHYTTIILHMGDLF